MRLRLYLFWIVTDTALLLFCFELAGVLYLGRFPSEMGLLQAQLLLPLYLTLALYSGVYSIAALQRPRDALVKLSVALIAASALLIFITFYTKSTATFSRAVFSFGFLGSLATMAAVRVATISFIRRKLGGRVINTVLIDAGGARTDIPGATRIDAAALNLVPSAADPHSLDLLGRFIANADRVVVSCPRDNRMTWAAALRGAGVNGEIVSDSLGELRPVGLRSHGNCISLVVSVGPLGLRARVMKRTFDTVLALALLTALSPLLLVCALVIKLGDGGPIFFVQQRMGRGNRLFSMFKFRSMRHETTDREGHRSASRDDDRVTPWGRFMRRTSIDELPQLLNILRGEMSFVGPRPHALGSQAGSKLFWEVDSRYFQRHALKPGLTGLAQVKGLRGATEVERDLTDRLQADLDYIAHWSLLNDFKIVVSTLKVLVHDRAF